MSGLGRTLFRPTTKSRPYGVGPSIETISPLTVTADYGISLVGGSSVYDVLSDGNNSTYVEHTGSYLTVGGGQWSPLKSHAGRNILSVAVTMITASSLNIADPGNNHANFFAGVSSYTNFYNSGAVPSVGPSPTSISIPLLVPVAPLRFITVEQFQNSFGAGALPGYSYMSWFRTFELFAIVTYE